MRAIFQIIANTQDISALIQDRLLNLSLTDKAGLDSDQCEIRLDDRDGKLAFPAKGAVLKISLGWQGRGLAFMGAYSVDEIEFEGPPATLIIRGKPAEMAKQAKNPRNHAWENVSLKQIVKDIAARNHWQAVCNMGITVPRADQVGVSDLHFLTKLARQYNATATVKDGKLIVMPRAGGKSATGKTLPSVTLTPNDVASYRFSFPDRSSIGSVKTKAHDAKTGKRIDIEIPNPDAPEGSKSATHTDRHTYPNVAAAKAAAQSRLASLNRGTAGGNLTMQGRSDLAAEKNIQINGFKREVDGIYLVESVTHSYAREGWTTSVEFTAGATGKAKAGHGKKTPRQIKIVIPEMPQ